MKDKTSRAPGSSAVLFTKDMTLVSYVADNDSSKKIVLLLSSVHGDMPLGSSGKPTIIEDYNKPKRGVNTFDQMCCQYSCSRKTKRWPLCGFYGSWMRQSSILGLSMKLIWRRQVAQHSRGNTICSSWQWHLSSPWAAHRLTVHSLPRQLRDVICTVCDLSTPTGPAGGAGVPAAEMREPLVRYVQCPSRTDNKTRFQCVTCQRAVCPSRYFTVRGNCVWGWGKL